MKKQIPLMLLTIFSAVCMTFSLTACGKNGDSLSVTENGGSKNSELVSDKPDSLEEWEAAFNYSDCPNFTIAMTSSYSNTFASTAIDGTESYYNYAFTENGISAHDYTSGTYITGNRGYKYELQETITDNDSTDENKSTYTDYSIFTETYAQYAYKEDKNEKSGIWRHSDLTTEFGYTPYTSTSDMIYVMQSYMGGVVLNSHSIIHISGSILGGSFIDYALLAGSSEDEYCSAVEYTNGAYVFRVTPADPAEINEFLEEEQDVGGAIDILNRDYTYTEYCDCYVKVNDGHISYIKLEYNYSVSYDDEEYGKYEHIKTETAEWSLYDYGTTKVTIPDEVTALFK